MQSLFTKSFVKYALLILCGIILLVIPLLRGSAPGTDPYLNLRLAENPQLYDSLSFGGRVAAYAWGTPLLLSLAPQTFLWLLPIILGLLSFMLYGRLLRSFIENEEAYYLSLLLFLLSPAFIYLFSSANTLFVSFFLALSGMVLFFSARPWFSVPVFAVIPLFDITVSIISLLLLLFATIGKKEKNMVFLCAASSMIIIGGAVYSYYLFASGFSFYHLPDNAIKPFAMFSHIFYDLGSQYGVGIFLFLLAGMGIFGVWKEKYKNLFIFLSIILLFFLSLFLSKASIFLTFILIPFASLGVLNLREHQWWWNVFKVLTLVIVLCGLLFSGLSQINRLVEDEPDSSILLGLEALRWFDPGVVFSDPSRGVWIESTGHPAVMDDNALFAPDAKQRWNDTITAFYSRNLGITEEIFNRYNVQYVWIDEDMKKNLWEYDTEGLLFILEYTKKFNKIYDREGVGIWRIENVSTTA